MKKYTENQKLFKHQQTRIKRYVKKLEGEGYSLPDNIVPEMPKRVTKKDISEIKGIKAKDIKKLASAVDIETGEIFYGDSAKKFLTSLEYRGDIAVVESKEEAEDQSYTAAKIVVDNFLYEVSHLPDRVRTHLKTLIDNALKTVDLEDVAAGIVSANPRFTELYQRMAYDSKGAAEEFSSALISMIPNISSGLRDDLEESFIRASW